MNKYSFEYCKNLAKECVSRTEFSKKHNFAYKISCKNGWIEKFLPSKKRELSYGVCKKKAQEFKTRIEFLKHDASMYQVCQNNNWLDDFFGVQKVNREKGATKYKYEDCLKLSKECKNRLDMKKKYPRAFAISEKNNWCNIFFGEGDKRCLDYEFCKSIAKKFLCRKELYDNDKSVYCKSLRMGWLDNFFKEKETSVLEKEIINFCKEHAIDYVYRSKKFEWLKDKRKLELDFYLEKYNVGIECQGIQHFEVRDFMGGEKSYKDLIKRDIKKKKLCDEHNIRLYYYTKYPIENVYNRELYKKGNIYFDLISLFKEIIGTDCL